MKTIILFLSLFSVYAFGQADSTYPEIQTKITLNDTDILMVSTSDTIYYTITYSAFKTLLNAIYLVNQDSTNFRTFSDLKYALGGHNHTGTYEPAGITESDISDLQAYLLAGDNATVLDGTAWRVFYTNGTGDVTELTLGANGTFLKSNGATSAPTFDTPSGSGDMLQSVYDINTNNTADDADSLGGVIATGYVTVTILNDSNFVHYTELDLAPNLIQDSLTVKLNRSEYTAGSGDMLTATYDVDDDGTVDDADSLAGSAAATYAKMADNETIAGNWVNTTNPWAENEVVSTLATETEAKGFISDSLDTYIVTATLQGGMIMATGSPKEWQEFSRQATADSMESAFEAVLDLQDLQGAVTDAQVPNTITITNISQVGDITATAAELNYTTDVTSNIQAQFTTFPDTLSFSFGVMDTTTVGDYPGWKVPFNITIVEISAYTEANTCTFNLEERVETTPNTAGTDVMTSDLVADNDQQEQTSFANAAIDINDWLVPTISATGDVEIFSITVRYIKTN